MATLLGAFAGVELLGLVGLLLGPLAISYLFELLRLYEAEYGRGVATQAGPTSTEQEARRTMPVATPPTNMR